MGKSFTLSGAVVRPRRSGKCAWAPVVRWKSGAGLLYGPRRAGGCIMLV
jgi:hypothetical protein